MRSTESRVLILFPDGRGKLIPVDDFDLHERGGRGVSVLDVDDPHDSVCDAICVSLSDQIMIVTSAGNIIRLNVSQINDTPRGGYPIRVVSLSDSESVASVARVG